MKHFEIGTEVAFDLNCPCGDCTCDGQDQGYSLYIIDGNEDEETLERCYIFSEEFMNKLR